ncbi:hypothetical protein FRX31_004834, partial [Thalictrum thalictroides]
MAKFVTWNARGLCNLDAQGSLKTLLSVSKANVVMIQETKAKEIFDSVWSLIFPIGWRWLGVPAIGLSGGMLLAWNSNEIS